MGLEREFPDVAVPFFSSLDLVQILILSLSLYSLGWFDALITNDDNCSATIDELEARVPGLRQVISHLIENAIFKLFYNTVFVR